jgi:hypothetical protein
LWARARLPSLLGQAGAGRLILYNKAEAALCCKSTRSFRALGVKGENNKKKQYGHQTYIN